MHIIWAMAYNLNIHTTIKSGLFCLLFVLFYFALLYSCQGTDNKSLVYLLLGKPTKTKSGDKSYHLSGTILTASTLTLSRLLCDHTNSLILAHSSGGQDQFNHGNFLIPMFSHSVLELGRGDLFATLALWWQLWGLQKYDETHSYLQRVFSQTRGIKWIHWKYLRAKFTWLQASGCLLTMSLYKE